jgi:hypothetical protein
MKDSHNLATLFVLVIVTGCIVMAVPVAAELSSSGTGSDVVTRGNLFAVTVTGKPNTAYYIWLTRTWSMTGDPGDQPPAIVSYQVPVTQDPSGGPYTIGSYAYYNGGGRTILDDVAPSSASMPNTSYYAKVTTDSTGQAVVALRTSSNTAAQKYTVKVQNPASPADDTVFVENGDTTTKRGSVSIGFAPTATLPFTIAPTPFPTTAVTVAETTIALPAPTAVPLTTAPTQQAPADLLIGIIAMGFVALAILRR